MRGTDDPTVRGPYGYGSIPPQPAPAAASQSRPELAPRTGRKAAEPPKGRSWSIVFVGMFAFLGAAVAFVVVAMLSRPESSLPTTSMLGTNLVPPPPVLPAPAPAPAAARPSVEDVAPLRIEHDRPHRTTTSTAAPKVQRRVVREQNW